ncbi:PHP domain-containing protein [Oscillospiraceae bacterium PP1C4]
MMPMKLDFHFHSTFSDGSETVDNIFKMAAEQGVTALALADHDTVLGIAEEINASRKYNIPYIPATEFTAREDGIAFHVLGYGIDHQNTALRNYSYELLDCMNKRSLSQIEQMQENGIDIAADEFFSRGRGGPLYRAKLLGVLADFGYLDRSKIMSLLPEYFGKDKPYYRADLFNYRSFAEIASMIHESGGIVVLAHPGKIKKKNEALYDRLIKSPLLDGVEIYHPKNSEDVREELHAIARERNLIYTGGSDYHGCYMKTPLSVGDVQMPEECLEFLMPYLSNH